MYIAQQNNPHAVPRDLYMMMYYLIRSYPELSERKYAVLYGSPKPPDGMPKTNSTSDPTADKAIVLANIDSQIHAVTSVVAELREKYHKTCTGETFDPYEAFMDYGVFCYYRSKPSKDEAPVARTWNRYRNEFIYKVAKKLNLF